MANNKSNKQVLADLQAELADRSSKAAVAQQAQAELTQRIGQLRGAMALDGVDHSQRIEQAQAELSAATALLATWPDVKAELQRRIAEAEQAVAQEKQAANLARWEVVSEQEALQRKEFAHAVVELAEIAHRLRTTIEERQALYLSVIRFTEGGRPTNWLPEFRPDWVYYGKADEAKAALAKLLQD